MAILQEKELAKDPNRIPRNSSSSTMGISTTLVAMYSTQRAGEALTLSYRFTNDPGDDEAWITVEGQGSYPNLRQWDTNRAKTNEHTAQLDYTLPIGNHTLEMGGKYILRQTDSKVNHRLFDETTNAWDEVAESFLDFTHTQNIYALYLGGLHLKGSTLLKVDLRLRVHDPAAGPSLGSLSIVPLYILHMAALSHMEGMQSVMLALLISAVMYAAARHYGNIAVLSYGELIDDHLLIAGL